MSDGRPNPNNPWRTPSPYGYNMPKYNPLKDIKIKEITNLCITHNTTWGTMIHNDNTVKVNQKFTFTNRAIFLSAWNIVKSLKGSSANIEDLTITIGNYADLSVYLDSNPLSEEE
ncbi:MAG: hypothetical protein HOE36_07505 [Flavobacteriaceae bacterium]|jgi:hypothetical protein|nr:hypothetical protein [Flavobacteriaceae bacterium]